MSFQALSSVRRWAWVTALVAVIPALQGCSDAEPSNNTGDAGQGGGDAGAVPLLRNPVTLDDRALAEAALAVIQSPTSDGSTYCGQCHGITRQTIRQWRALSDNALATCLSQSNQRLESATVAQDVVRCLRGGNDTGNYEPSRLGIYSTAANLAWFRALYGRAGGANTSAAHTALVNRVVMPPVSVEPQVTQAQFDLMAEWFARGVPHLDEILPEDPRPETCTAGVSADVAAHVRAMQTRSWATLNRERNLLMHGCAGASNTLGCLSTVQPARETDFGRTWDVVANTTLRVLFTTNYSSAYWTRSSADGRFVAHGARTSAPAGRFIDLARNTVITAAGQYDPAFFPDNSGFVFFDQAAYACEHSLLTMTNLSAITFQESQCRRANSIGLYEHVAASLEGNDYWTIDSQFESDDGGHSATLRNPRAPFTSAARAKFNLMGNTGSGFTQRQTINVPMPFEGDATMSPSGLLVATRVAGPSSTQLGYVLRRVNITQEGGQYSITLPEVARYCMTGSKATFSYDERFMVLHHYITDEDAAELGFTGADDPNFAEYRTRGGSNVYLVDLLSGQRTRLTNMRPGQYAHSPHFRADGWLYFMVRNAGTRVEYVVASDAPLRLAMANP
ncbi:MAG: hypothetical protein JNK72_23750 [Myxococcales bacterium]|nr:hypothetical protein [Myxococcales bacterium]